jgi:cytochrome c-type biogenesis protein CcmH
MTTTSAAISKSPVVSRLSRLAVSRWAWALLVVVATVTLSLGSIHHQPADASSRAAYLDSIIKCPSCDDLSIAQSDAGVAAGLRHEVRQMIARGWSNDRIEQFVVSQYGSDEILTPSSDLAWLIPLIAGSLAFAAIGGALVRARLRRHRRASAEEEALVEAALRHLQETPWTT